MTKRNVVTLGDRVRAARDKLGITQFELASRSGVRVEVISRIETGRNQGSLLSLHKLTPVLGVTIDHLVGTPAPVKQTAEVAKGKKSK